MAERYVLDAFAVVAFFEREPGAQQVAELLARSIRNEIEIGATTVNLGEALYTLERRHGQTWVARALQRIDHEWALDLHDVDRALALHASELKGRRRLGYLDCFAAALALRLGATVVTGDHDFELVEDLVPIDWLAR